MTSIRDRFRNEAKQGGSNFTKLSPDLTFEVKQNKDTGQVSFVYYDKEKKENRSIVKPIEGALIGRCMQASWFDANIGQRGGNWQTSFFYTKDKVVLFKPGSTGYEKVMDGTFDEIDSYVRSRGVTATAKKAQVLFVKIKGTEKPLLVAVKTNLSIAITQLNGVTREMPFDYFVKLTPVAYEEGQVEFSKKTTQSTKNLMRTNPPKYASISFQKPMNDIEFDLLGAGESMETFQKWLQEQKPVSGEAASATEQPAAPAPRADLRTTHEPTKEEFDSFEAPIGGDDDDIPF
jgi:hypothetical protein